MSSPLSLLRAGPPPPKVALLPDSAFFTRQVGVTAGATPTEAAALIELALEGLAPFPLSQLYYGWFWRPGAETALLFAAYRRRFTAEQVAEWEGAELVLPTFAATLGASVEPATTLLLVANESITAVHWATAESPAEVRTLDLPAEADDDARARVKSELIAAFGGSRHVIEVASAPAPDPARSDGEIAFRAGELISRLPAAAAAAADVRDKAELAALRAARRRDIVLWRAALGLAASLLVLGLGELALVGGRVWQRTREAKVAAQRPVVEKIESVDTLTNKIEELATKRLRPIEMLLQLVGENYERQPADIWFTRVSAEAGRGLNTIFVEGRTTNAAQVNAYEAALRKLPSVEKVEAPLQALRGDQAQFTLTATFKAEALAGPAAAGETPKPQP
ncbi:MAG: hypothetical protein RLZZ188_2391 [Verrucomicrobiota bacterium]